MPPKKTWPSTPGTPGVETRAAKARRLAAETANASNPTASNTDASNTIASNTIASNTKASNTNASDTNASDADTSNEARRAAANATISPITPSPPHSPTPRSASIPPSTGNTRHSDILSRVPTVSPRGPRSPSQPSSTGNTRYSNISSRAPTASFQGSPSPLPPPPTGSTRYSNISSRPPTVSSHGSPSPLPAPSTGSTRFSDISSRVPSASSRRTRPPSIPSSTGSIENSAFSSSAPAGAAPNSAPFTPRSMWRTSSPLISSSSSDPQSDSSPAPTPATPAPPNSFDSYRGGPSDTPPVSIFTLFPTRELPNRSVSRQLYLHLTLTSIRNRSTWSTSILPLLHFRFITYPFRMYIRPFILTYLFLFLLFTTSIFLSVCWPPAGLGKTPTTENPHSTFLFPLLSAHTSIPLTWLSLHLFDLYRAISYTALNSPSIFPGHWTNLSIRLCAMLRPLARLTVALSVLLSCLEPNMTLQDWGAVISKMASETFTLSLLCGGVEVFVYWFVGFFRRRRWMVYAMGEAEIGVFERWEVERVMPWGTGVAVWLAGRFCKVGFEVVGERVWWLFP